MRKLLILNGQEREKKTEHSQQNRSRIQAGIVAEIPTPSKTLRLR